MEKLSTASKNKPGVDCGSDHEFLIAKFRLKLKEVRKTTKPFRYGLNQIPYDYAGKVRHRLKGLDLIDRVPEELWVEVLHTEQEAVIKTIPRKRNAKRQNGLLRGLLRHEEALQIAEKRGEVKPKEKRKDISI